MWTWVSAGLEECLRDDFGEGEPLQGILNPPTGDNLGVRLNAGDICKWKHRELNCAVAMVGFFPAAGGKAPILVPTNALSGSDAKSPVNGFRGKRGEQYLADTSLHPLGKRLKPALSGIGNPERYPSFANRIITAVELSRHEPREAFRCSDAAVSIDGWEIIPCEANQHMCTLFFRRHSAGLTHVKPRQKLALDNNFAATRET